MLPSHNPFVESKKLDQNDGGGKGVRDEVVYGQQVTHFSFHTGVIFQNLQVEW